VLFPKHVPATLHLALTDTGVEYISVSANKAYACEYAIIGETPV